jgi:hypothetical protein
MLNNSSGYFSVFIVDSVGVLRESVALDASHGSGRATPHLAPQDDDEGSDMSDWDSWEDEEEVSISYVYI